MDIELIAAESPASPSISFVKAGTAEPMGANASTMRVVLVTASQGKR